MINHSFFDPCYYYKLKCYVNANNGLIVTLNPSLLVILTLNEVKGKNLFMKTASEILGGVYCSCLIYQAQSPNKLGNYAQNDRRKGLE